MIARIGNGLAALLFGILTIVYLKANNPHRGASLSCPCSAAGLFNILRKVISMCIRNFSEEEGLKTEIRKAELRRELAELQEKTDGPPSGNHGNTNRTTAP